MVPAGCWDPGGKRSLLRLARLAASASIRLMLAAAGRGRTEPQTRTDSTDPDTHSARPPVPQMGSSPPSEPVWWSASGPGPRPLWTAEATENRGEPGGQRSADRRPNPAAPGGEGPSRPPREPPDPPGSSPSPGPGPGPGGARRFLPVPMNPLQLVPLRAPKWRQYVSLACARVRAVHVLGAPPRGGGGL